MMGNKNADKTRVSPEPPATSPATTQSAAREISSDVHRLLHQFKQPITAIGNYARAGIQLIDTGMSDTARLKELFEKIAAQSARTTECSRDLGTAVSQLAPGDEQ